MSKRQTESGALVAAPAPPHKTAIDVFLETGSYPKLGDDVPPWRYKGFLLFPVSQAEAMFYEDHPQEVMDEWTKYMAKKHGKGFRLHARRAGIGRWEYYMRMQMKDGLLDEPIPELHFSDNLSESDQGMKHAMKLIEVIEENCGFSSGLALFIDWLAWALGTSISEPSTLPDNIQEMLYRQFDASVWLNEPADYLGTLLAMRKGNGRWNNPHAFYPTPDAVCELMTRMVAHDMQTVNNPGVAGTTTVWVDQRHQTVCDPCMGTGRMLLHAGSFSLRLYGMDIDPVVLKAALINGALFCPWLTFGAPDRWFDKPSPPVKHFLEIAAQHYEPADQASLMFVNAGGQGCLFGEEIATGKARKGKRDAS